MIAFLVHIDIIDFVLAIVFGAFIGIVAFIIYEFNHPLIVTHDYDRPDFQAERDEQETAD